MTNTNKGLKMAEKIIFVLAGIVSFVSMILAMFTDADGNVMVTFGQYLSQGMPVVSIAIMAIGFILVMFAPKKNYFIGLALFLATPLWYLVLVLTQMLNAGDSGYSLGLGSIMMIVGLILLIVSILIHGIGAIVDGNNNDAAKVDERIAIVKTYKEYKDEGVITEEEYQAKKNEILGIKANAPKKDIK